MRRSTFILVIDILGYEKLAEEISSTTKLKTSHIRRSFFLDPLDQALHKFQNSIDYRQLTDNFLVFVYDLKIIFEIIAEVSKLSIPFNEPQPVPFEIGIAMVELDEGIDPIHQDETIAVLKEDLLKYYREYHRNNTGTQVMGTFVVITKDFYESLPEDRQYLCKQIVYINDKGRKIEFYVAEPKMMQDVSGRDINNIVRIRKFLEKIQSDHLWEYFELKALIFRDAETRRWITQFIYVRLLDEPVIINSLRTRSLILIHQVYNMTELRSILDLVISSEFQIGDFPSTSLEYIDGSMEYHFCGYINNYRIRDPADMFGVSNPAHVLLKGGKSFSKLKDSEMSMFQDLQNYDQMSPVIDAVRQHLNLHFWNFVYSTFFVAIAPLPMQMPRIFFNDNQIEVRIRCSENIDRLDLEVRIIGRRGNENTNLRIRNNNFVRIDEDIVYNTNLEVGDEDGLLVDLYCKGHQFESCYVKRE